MPNAVRSALWTNFIYKKLPDIPEAAEWPAEDVVEELRRRASVSAAPRRGNVTEASSNPSKRAQVHPDAAPLPFARPSLTTGSVFVAAVASTAVASTVTTASAIASVGDKRRTRSTERRSRSASPTPTGGLNRTIASRAGVFTAWWNTSSYTVLSSLGFNKAGADDLHKTTMITLNKRFRKRYARLIENGKTEGTWGGKGSVVELSTYASSSSSAAALHASRYVMDEDLLSVCHNNLATDWAVLTFFRMICFASRTVTGPSWACVPPQLVSSVIMANNTTPGMESARDTAKEFVSGITTEYIAAKGVSNVPLWVPITLPGHFIVFLYLPVEKLLLVCDPLGAAYAKKRTADIAAFVAWLRDSLGRNHALTVKFCDVPKQTDATSCGPFCMAYILYALLHGGRPPPSTAWSGANANCIRAAVASILLTGKVPLAGGGSIDVAGAGLPQPYKQ